MNRIKVEHVFLFLALLFGLVWVFLIPPFQSPDEQSHFRRSWSISEGRVFLERERDKNGYFVTGAGAYLPAGAANLPGRFDYRLVRFRRWVKFRFGNFRDYVLSHNFRAGGGRVFKEIGSEAYCPVAYIPQTAGILAGRALGLSPLGCFYAARIFALLFYAFATFAALRIMPFGRNMLMIVALLPMSLSIGASLNTDIVLNGMLFLFIAYVLNQTFKRPPEPISGKEVAIFLAFCMAIAFLKPVYTPIALLLLMIPKERFSGRGRVLFLAGCFVLTFALMAAWSLAVRRAIDSGDVSIGLNPKYQFHVALAHPLRMLGIIYNGYVHYGAIFKAFVGILGWLDFTLPHALYLLAGLLLASSVAVPQGVPGMGLRPRVLLLAFFALAFAGVNFAMFVEATKVGADSVGGVQGRYFTSIVPAALLAISNTSKKYFNWPVSKVVRSPLFIGSCMAAMLLSATYYIVLRYYYCGHLSHKCEILLLT